MATRVTTFVRLSSTFSAAVLLSVSLGGNAMPLPEYRNPVPDPVIRDILAAKTDVWGEAALRQPDGPTYDFFRDLLPPLRYCDPEFRHYPIVLAAPLSEAKARLISNGSAVNAKPTGSIEWRLWKEYAVSATFKLGEEVFGSDLARLDGPRYLKGYMPIVQMSYRLGDSVCEQESFVPVFPPYSTNGGMIVRFSLKAGKPLPITATLDSSSAIQMKDGAVRDDKDSILVQPGDGWKWDEHKKSLSAVLESGKPLVLAVFSRPVAVPDIEVNDSVYKKQRNSCIKTWNGILSRGMYMQAPEEIVNNAWRSLIVGSMMMANGDAMCYGAGNGYERMFLAESGDSMRSLMVWGYGDEARRMTVPLLNYVQPGLKYHEAGHKLQILSHVYWMTRDRELLQKHKDRWMQEVKFITDDREAESGLLPKDDYAGDIPTKVYSLNSNANSWRGLRDIAAVMDDMGDKQEATKLVAAAGDLRKAILAAVEKSEDRTTSPPFIPNALFGEEKAYDVLTSSRMGSYWNLLIPYVLGSGVFGVNAEREGWIVDYLQQHGGIAMGMIRFHQESGAPDYDSGLDDLYGLRYTQALLRRDNPDRALVSFYGKLAQGMTRDTFICAEGTGLVPLDKHGRALSMPPNSSGNALFLTTLREMLVQDLDMDDDGRPDTLRLLFATPRGWMREGAEIKLSGAPTVFGKVSVASRSELGKGRIIIDVEAPARAPKSMLIRARVPEGWRITGASVGDERLRLTDVDTADLSGRTGKMTITFSVAR